MLLSNRTRCFTFAALTGAMLCAAATRAADDEKATGEPITAIWKLHQVDFSYRSPNIQYECDSLRKRVPQILQAVGAYSNMVIDVKNCARRERVHTADISVTFAMPAAATEENIREAVDFDSRNQLVVRIRGERMSTAEDVKRFPAVWRTVTLSGGTLKLAAGDCDLVRVMRDDVFPLINVSAVGAMNCGAGPDTRIRPKIRVKALMPAQDRGF